MKPTTKQLTEILRLHKLWLIGDPAGVRANLSYANLRSADLRSADLRSADLRSANLRSVDLRSADLSSANLSYADLSSADLSYADLRSADLRSADLRYADLSSADLSSDVRIVSVSGIGTVRRMTTYRADTDEVWCGCFEGTLAEFSSKVKVTHKENPEHLAHYLAAVKFFKAYRDNKGEAK